MTPVRTRFAPSPTGALHLGNVRIAVFNWLFARHHGGDFVLRVEDTDPGRTREGAEARIRDDLRWLGLEWDEGPDVGGPAGPYRQSERLERYREVAARLVEADRAYPCYCTAAELEAQRKTVGGGREVLRYSGRCRSLTPKERRALEEEGREAAVRFAAPGEGDIEVTDEVRGSIPFPANEIDDFVILRSDGRPTYNFAVVVDDAAMEITHVIRGAGHLSNTPKQALLFDVLEGARPRFAHLPTVLSPEGGKLSKREGAAAVADLREAGYHPDGVVNYLSLLGWSSPDEAEVLTREELVDRIGLDRVGAADTTYDPEKLRWISGEHIARMPPGRLVEAVRDHLDRDRYPLDDGELERALEVVGDRLSTFSEVNRLLSLLHPAREALEAEWEELSSDDESRPVLEAVRRRIADMEPWEPAALGEAIRNSGRSVGVSGRGLFHPLRRALTAKTSGPELGQVVWALGREEAAGRLDAALGEGRV